MTLPVELNDPTNEQPVESQDEILETEARAEQTLDGDYPSEPKLFKSPDDTRDWKPGRQDGIETFTLPDGTVYTRISRADEPEDAVVTFIGPRSRGMTPMRLVLAENSWALKGAARKKRRENAELRKRGYEV